MSTGSPTRIKVIDAAIMAVVSALSLFLLVYVGYGEANRTYPRFQIEKMVAQGEVVQNALESYLRAGLPLSQFPGYKTIAEPINEDKLIASIIAYDTTGKAVFEVSDEPTPRLAPGPATEDQRYNSRRDDKWYQIALPLRNKFEQVGELTVTMPAAVMQKQITPYFPRLLWLAGGLCVLFAAFAALTGDWLQRQRFPWLEAVYGLTFFAMAVAVVATLVTIYAEGAQAKAKALADSLGQRLSDIVDYRLDISDFDGIARTFADYRRLNPDIQAIGLTLGGNVAIHTDQAAIGSAWKTASNTYEYTVDIGNADQGEVRVAVSLPVEIVYRAVARSVKNFAVLFIASAFMAALFLQLARSIRKRALQAGSAATAGDETVVALVKPIFFISVFIENLYTGFLPQLIQRSAAEFGLGSGATSAAFMAYFVGFLLTLIPASHYADQHGSKRLVYSGSLLAAIGCLLLATTESFPFFVVARLFSGVGQGVLFIGIQTFILNHTPAGKRTQGAAIIVFGFNGGMISGAAIGSLLVNYMGPPGVFTVGCITGLLLACYTMLLMQPEPGAQREKLSTAGMLRKFGADVPRVLGSMQFLRAMALVGLPAKAILTGVIAFALPLVLSRQHFVQEDIGQIIMLYAIGVLVASGYISRLVDRAGKTKIILFTGTFMSGIGLLLIGAVGWSGLPAVLATPVATTLMLIAGVATVGLAHGFVNAPVVTHIADTDVARDRGPNGVTALYRVLERVGHVAGPMLAGQLLVLSGQSAISIGWAGVALVVFALLFIIPVGGRRAPQPI